MRNTYKYGFTLVELIVVITILAILGTLAFISLQGYSQDAKGSKVISDIRSISSVIETRLTQGNNSVHSFIRTANSNNIVTNIQNGSGTFQDGASLSGSTYNVGTIDFITLQQDGTDFYNSAGEDTYRIGTLSKIINNKYYRFYQIAGIKGNTDTFVSIVKGNYIYKGSDELGLISSQSGTIGLENNVPIDNNGL